MTDQKIITILNKIRDNGTLDYKNAVPKLTENMLLNVYGASILNQPFVLNEFLNSFANYFMYEETKQHMFESEFDRLKTPIDGNRYGTFEAFRNTVKPMEYDETQLARILRLYKPDVKTAYFARNRQDIFPMSIVREELIGAFADFRKFDEFVTGLYQQLVNSNKVVEYNAIKECINVNVQGGAIKKITIPQIDSTTAPSIAKMIRSYVTKMTKPSTQYNAYADLEGATGDPVETSTPKKSLVLIANADTIAELSVDVLASAFNLPYADFQINLIEVDDFGYNVYDRNTRTVLDRKSSKIQFMICDEALFKIQDMLDVTMQGTNDATFVKQTFYHVWQAINVRPWANALAFCYEEDVEITEDGNTAQYNEPVTVNYLPTTATIDVDQLLKTEKGANIEITQPESLTDETTDIKKIAYKVGYAFYNTGITVDDNTAGTIVVSRNSNKSFGAGTYTIDTETDPDTVVIISPDEFSIYLDTYGKKTFIEVRIEDATDITNYEVVRVPLANKSIWSR